MKTAAVKDSSNKPVKPLRLLLYSVAGVVLWLLAWECVDHLKWAHQWRILKIGDYVYQIGVILLLVLFGAACLAGPCVFVYRALRYRIDRKP